MVYDSIANALIPTAGSNTKELGKKKRVNRTAKLKQSKLDVRREQWLSQVKNKGFKEENRGADRPKTPPSDMHAVNEVENRTMVELVINPASEENDGSMNHYSDWESPSNSPTSHTSSLTSSRSVTNFTGGSSSRSSSSSSGGCYSGSMTEEDDGDDGCLDDWEAIADALAADEIKSDHDNHNHNLNPDSQVHDSAPQLEEPVETMKDDDHEKCHVQVNRRAWRPDDAFRPQGLPNLVKQNSFPMNTERNHGFGAWGFKNAGFTSTPVTCPICCEDLDLTDSSFFPCPCGYRLCLFCYKRILEDNGRCPGCRKQYEQCEQGFATFKMARSYSMISSR